MYQPQRLPLVQPDLHTVVNVLGLAVARPPETLALTAASGLDPESGLVDVGFGRVRRLWFFECRHRARRHGIGARQVVRLSVDSDRGIDMVDASAASDVPTTPQSLYGTHREKLLRAATLMVDDRSIGEEVVHDAFVELLARWDRIDHTRALGYLYRSVTNRCRSVLRRRRTVRAFRPLPAAPSPGSDEPVLRIAGHAALVAAVRHLPTRQRQVLVLRYFSELSIADTAAALGISEGAVSVAASHAFKTLRLQREELT